MKKKIRWYFEFMLTFFSTSIQYVIDFFMSLINIILCTGFTNQKLPFLSLKFTSKIITRQIVRICDKSQQKVPYKCMSILENYGMFIKRIKCALKVVMITFGFIDRN